MSIFSKVSHAIINAHVTTAKNVGKGLGKAGAGAGKGIEHLIETPFTVGNDLIHAQGKKALGDYVTLDHLFSKTHNGTPMEQPTVRPTKDEPTGGVGNNGMPL